MKTGMHVFVLGLDDHNRQLLERLPGADSYHFHALLDYESLRQVDTFPIDAMLERCRRRLESHRGSVDAIVTLLDFPAAEMVPILTREYGLPGPSLEAVLKADHKYWSRLLQREVAAGHVPAFAAFDASDEAALSRLIEAGLEYPFWIKPFNAFRSLLAFRIHKALDFELAQSQLCEGLPRLSEPLAALLRHATLPAEIAALPPSACLAEAQLTGRLCTLEGYVHGGRPVVYGVVDSIREPNRASFARYQYPSRLPRRVRLRMGRIAGAVIRRIGLNDCPFNIEMFYDEAADHISILEINPRLSQSHCALFEMVDGTSHHKVMLEVALGHGVQMPKRAGPCRCAAKFFLRAHGEDAQVSCVPDPQRIAEIERAIPHTEIILEVREGMQLSQLRNQDSYSFELGEVYIGADNQRQLLRRFARCEKMLDIRLSPLQGD